MSRRLSRILLALVILLSSEVWALGLGEIKLDSALNEPLRAEIELLSAATEELDNLQIALASAEMFDRYGLDRPVYLQGIEFMVIRSGRADGNVVEIRSLAPMTEPFLTFLVEASWSRGRLLREYTVLLDPPTFAPPATSTPAVSAPTRSAPTDSGRIERAAPAPASPRSEPPPQRVSPPSPQRSTPAAVDDSPYDTATGGDYSVSRGDTLWGIAQRWRPDGRLSMNQTMLAIFQANPQAFGGNINLLRAGASLRIPSADEIFRISRGDATSEVARQHTAWGSGVVAQQDDASSRPNLQLVPPDDDYADDAYGADGQYDDEVLTREQEIDRRIDELEASDVPQQQSLIEIRDNELAALRQELARIRGEVYVPPSDDLTADEPLTDGLDDDPFLDDEGIMVDDDAPIADQDGEIVDETPQPEDVAEPTPSRSASIVDQIIAALTTWWAAIVGVLVVVAGLLFWFMRRGRDDDQEPDAWRALDADDMDGDSLSATESLRAPTPQDDSIMVVEQESAAQTDSIGTIESERPDFAPGADTIADTGEFGSLEDTFSSDTAINLDQSDPIAEADFHMAYGLYDQAADLINGALGAEPNRADLLTKLCEIYFVWGNRDAFIDGASRLKKSLGGTESADWDKIVIMGQQIAGDNELFAGAGVAAPKAVDLSFEAGMGETGSLDMEFIADAGAASDVVDMSDDAMFGAAAAPPDVDFVLDAETAATEVMTDVELDSTAASPTVEADFDLTAELPGSESTVEVPATDSTLETPTIEEQFDVLSGTAELPSLDETVGDAIVSSGQSADSTAEINLDDLGLNLGGLAETEIASLDDLDASSETEALSTTGINEELEDLAEVTGKNPEVDPNATGVLATLKEDDTGINEELMETGAVDIDSSLLDATGVTQVIPDDMAVETLSDVEDQLADESATMLAPGYGDTDTGASLGNDEATMLAGLDEDEDDFDFAKTEALPAEVFTDDPGVEETGELPAVASTIVDLDLDDLTAALQVSEMGDTVEQMRDDATVEQPRPDVGSDYDDVATMALEPGEMSDDLADARTMTEVGTKLDLARAYVDMGDPAGARSILEEVLDEGDEAQRQQAQQLLDSLPS